MNARDRFRAIARFERADDPFFFGVGLWKNTFRRWVREGMPVALFDEKAKNEHLIGHQDQLEFIEPNAGSLDMSDDGDHTWGPPLVPYFEEKVVEEDSEYLVRIARDGGTTRINKKERENMPQWIDYPVKTCADWLEYRRRLDPHSPERYPAGWDTMNPRTVGWPLFPGQDGVPWSARGFPLGMMCLTLYGGPRYAMGLERLSMAIYDDPLLVEEMVEWQTQFSLEMLSKVFASGVTLDFAWIFEDMCYKTAPMVSPHFVKAVMAPRYRRVVDLLHEHGVKTILLDSDGQIEQLLPIWIECGINGTYPCEVASGMDGLALRKKFGKNLLIVGNIDKRTLARGKAAMDAELERVHAILRLGGYFPSVDHHVPPDVPYESFVYFMNRLRSFSAYPESRRVIGS
jgi:hypothetical protein